MAAKIGFSAASAATDTADEITSLATSLRRSASQKTSSATTTTGMRYRVK